MSKFDEIIGYAQIKNELKQISDTLKNPKNYEKLGISAPTGLLLYGDPGVGKSLMANAVIEDSGRNVFVCRKNKPNGEFINEIKKTFDMAVENAPSIVFLDDMDKFTNGDMRHRDAEEYVTIQSCIDEIKGKSVFVIATVNETRVLPDSLLRAGRFDRSIEVLAPCGKDAEKIIAHYLEGKKISDDVDVKAITKLLDGKSCAELETVINEAGLYAGYKRLDTISMEHITNACLRMFFDFLPPCYDDSDTDVQSIMLPEIIYHEAGHAVVSEVLCPESVSLIYVGNGKSRESGITHLYNNQNTTSQYWAKSRLTTVLAGAASTEQKFGTVDSGAHSDYERAFDLAERLVEENCIDGLQLFSFKYNHSQHHLSAQEQVVMAEVERYYRKAKEIIALNKEFLEKLAAALAEKKLLCEADIKKIKDECKIVPVAL